MPYPGKRTAALLGFAALLIAVPLAAPHAYFLDIATKTWINALVCVGLNLLAGYAGQISLGHAAFFANGAYVPALLASHFGLPPLAGIALSLVSAALVALAIG
jgi:branched-chain amino acid transport system permease protein